MTGAGPLLRGLPAARPLAPAVVVARHHAALLEPGRQREGALCHPGGVRPGGRRHGGQRRPHRHGRTRPGAQHRRRPGRLAGDGLRRHRDRADEHVPGRSAHPGRGGVRPRRAGASRRRRPARDDHGRPCCSRAGRQRPASAPAWPSAWSRCPWPSPTRSRSGSAWPLCGLVFTGVALRGRPAHLDHAGDVRRDRHGDRASPTCCARSVTSGAIVLTLAVADRLVPAHVRLLRPALVAVRCCSSPPRPADRGGVRRCSPGATTAPASWLRAPGPAHAPRGAVVDPRAGLAAPARLGRSAGPSGCS